MCLYVCIGCRRTPLDSTRNPFNGYVPIRSGAISEPLLLSGTRVVLQNFIYGSSAWINNHEVLVTAHCLIYPPLLSAELHQMYSSLSSHGWSFTCLSHHLLHLTSHRFQEAYVVSHRRLADQVTVSPVLPSSLSLCWIFHCLLTDTCSPPSCCLHTFYSLYSLFIQSIHLFQRCIADFQVRLANGSVLNVPRSNLDLVTLALHSANHIPTFLRNRSHFPTSSPCL
jgi:hypothetical protein